MKNTLKVISGSLVAVALLAAIALPASAAVLNAGITAAASGSVGVGGTSVGVGLSAAVQARVNLAVSRANQEITRRINALNALNARVNVMVKLSASDKSNLSSSIQTQLTNMTNLQARIAADGNNTSSLKTDIQSITVSYRIFALIIPQGAIEAASDRVQDVTSMMTDLETKLQARITADQSAGDNVSAEVSAMADFNAKVSDANTQAQAAVTEVASLQPDNGNATIMASNTAALKDARTKIQASQQDLITARADAQTIIKGLVSLEAAASSTTSVSGSASATTTNQ